MDDNYAEYSPVSRRQALVGIGTLATGSVGVAVVGTETAGAQVSVENWSVSDAEFTDEQANPRIDAAVAYSYDVGSQPVARLLFELSVGGDVVGTNDLRTDHTTLSNDTTLSGLVTDSSAWSASDFAPEVASSVTRELTIGVRFAVLDSSDGVIVEDSAQDTASVTVSHPQESQWVAEVGGSGSITNVE